MVDRLIQDENVSRIITSLRESRKTIKQLASATGIPERHVRSAMDEMREQKFVIATGFYDRSQVWRINSAVLGFAEGSARLPYHDLQSTGASANLIDIALAGMIKSSMLPDPATVTQIDYRSRTIYLLLAELVGEIKEFPDQETIDEIRSQLLQAYKVLSSTTNLLKQILNTKEYWSAKTLAELRDAPLLENAQSQINDTAALARIYRIGEISGDTESI